jgi:cytochrome c553
MKYTLLLATLTTLGLSACGSKEETPAPMPEAAAPAAPAPEAAVPEAPAAAPEVTATNNAGEAKYKAVCASCHGAQAEGKAAFPKLAGQSAADLKAKLEKYRKGEKIGSMSTTMMPMAKALSDQQVDDVTAYIAGLK